METVSEIERHLITAFRAGEWDKAKQIVELTRDGEVVRQAEVDAKERRKEIDRQIATLTGRAEPSKDFKGRRIRLKVTQGSVGHSYLLVTRALDDGLLSRDEKLKITAPATGEAFVTDIHGRNKHLNERHKIGRFYKAAGIKSGDFVQLEEIAHGEWSLTKCPPTGSE